MSEVPSPSATSRILIFDTTLRDGEQSPGASLNLQEKVEIAHALEQLGVDIIEAGFPITSPGDFEAVRTIGKEIKRATVAGLARCTERDVRRAGDAVQGAAHGRIHIFCATSKIHREFKLRKAKDEIIRLTVESIKLAREYVADIEFSPEDASRTEPDFLADVVHAAIDAGATTINCPDTVGYTTPEEYRELFAQLIARVPGAKNVIFSAHCHDDLGLAVANSLAAVAGGARQIECTINGIGERAGNAALEEIAMAVRTRPDFYPYTTGIVSNRLVPISRLVSTLTGMHVQRNKAIVGDNAFAHESGIHQDGMLKERRTYEIISPEDVGLIQTKLVLGKHSGRHAFRNRLEELGHRLDDASLDKAFEKFKILCDKKKEIYDEDLEALVEQQLEGEKQLFQLTNLQVMSGMNGTATAMVSLTDASGTVITDAATGDGPIDAMFAAISRLTHIAATLDSFQVRSVTGGKEAQGEVSVELSHSGRKIRGRGFSTDILEASARAYLAAINRIRTMTERTIGQASSLEA